MLLFLIRSVVVLVYQRVLKLQPLPFSHQISGQLGSYPVRHPGTCNCVHLEDEQLHPPFSGASVQAAPVREV